MGNIKFILVQKYYLVDCAVGFSSDGCFKQTWLNMFVVPPQKVNSISNNVHFTVFPSNDLLKYDQTSDLIGSSPVCTLVYHELYLV